MQNNMQPEEWERLIRLVIDFIPLASLAVRACRMALVRRGRRRNQATRLGFVGGDGI